MYPSDRYPAMELIKTPKIENVRLLDRYNVKRSSIGTLYLTATHLIFVDPDNKKETWIGELVIFQVLLMHIASVEKLPLTATGSPLLIRCKTFLSVTFIVPRERDCHEVFVTLQQLSQPVNIEELYSFRYTSSCEDIPKSAGWNFFDLQAEYQRMRAPNDQWSLTLLNQEYELCDTYPRYLYVPSSASTAVLLGSSKFRSKGRLPVLSYLHKNKATICRCSQPLSGFSARCLEDEHMLNRILKTNPNSSCMYVVDIRPRINAMANRATGKGYENENFYENIKFQFLGIENIHVMRNSLVKLIEIVFPDEIWLKTCLEKDLNISKIRKDQACELKSPTMSTFLNGLEGCGWLRHIKSIMDTSWFVAKSLDQGVSVLVHCSDGWDRTAQVISLGSLILDPYYRTIQGFQALIEKDWLSFGHKFTDRVGHLAGDPKEISPIFTQFIDCVWQLMQQFPAIFQFNERFLLTLHDHLSSCQYGTFIGNCEKDRIDLRLSERTFSLWGYMANHMAEYMNPLYKSEKEILFIEPNLSPQNIRFWKGLYCRFEDGIHPRENLEDLFIATIDHSNSLEDHLKFLIKRIKNIKTFITNCENKLKDNLLIPNWTYRMDIDNKILYDKFVELSRFTSLDLPLKGYSSLQETFGYGGEENKQISFEIIIEGRDLIALDWKTLRNIKECICSTPFDHFTRKYHCWQCGDVFCTRCMDRHVALPGHLSQCAVPVCGPCYKKITHSSSLDTP